MGNALEALRWRGLTRRSVRLRLTALYGSLFLVSGAGLLVLDRDLPGIHGDAICRMIAGGDQQVMVLMLTAADAPGQRAAGLALGADDYLVKPFHFPELVLRVRALGRRKPAAQGRILRAAGIELDQLARTVTRGGRPIELSAKELGVLEALLRASPGVLSAEQLLEQVWDANADPFTKTVAVTISRLRRKLGGPDAIQTIPSVGYRIADPDSVAVEPRADVADV